MSHILISLANQRRILERLATELNGKMDVVQYDTTPTQGSNNIMTSGSIYTALGHYLNNDTLDDITDADIDAMFADTPAETATLLVNVVANNIDISNINPDMLVSNGKYPATARWEIETGNTVILSDYLQIVTTVLDGTQTYIRSVNMWINDTESDLEKNRTYQLRILGFDLNDRTFVRAAGDTVFNSTFNESTGRIEITGSANITVG